MSLTHSIDLSNWNGRLAGGTVACLQTEGYTHVVVRASLETEAKADIARQQLAALQDGGISVACYAWCYFNEDPAQMVADTLAVYRDYAPLVYWLDAEETDARWTGESPEQRRAWLETALAAFAEAGVRAGIYSGRWWWDAYMQGQHLPGVPLWTADYDDIPVLYSEPYGGMVVVGKQYAGSGTGRACGMHVDLNVFDTAWLLGEETPMPEPGTTYNPDTSPEYQTLDWTCSVNAITWCLRSLGFDVNAVDIRHQMLEAGLVSPQHGLLDGSGTALAKWLERTYGVEPVNCWTAIWEWAQNCAGMGPIAIGGGHWNHWAAVRRADGDGLEIMNPAPGHMGVWHHLTKADWDRLGPWAALWLPVQHTEEEDMDCADYISRLALIEHEYVAELERLALEIEDAHNIGAARKVVRHGLNPLVNTIKRVAAGEEA